MFSAGRKNDAKSALAHAMLSRRTIAPTLLLVDFRFESACSFTITVISIPLRWRFHLADFVDATDFCKSAKRPLALPLKYRATSLDIRSAELKKSFASGMRLRLVAPGE
jgi:hypothetical protein